MSLQVVIRFGDFELDPERYELRRAGTVQRLEKIPMELLLLLAGRPGALVSRAEIATRLWGPDIYVEAERGINTAIGKIRRVLEDDPNQPRYLQTVVGKGYRFIADILPPENQNRQPAFSSALEPAVPVRAPEEKEDKGTPEAPHNRLQQAVLGASALALVAAILIATNPLRLRDALSLLISPRIRSIAVLPMSNLAHDPAQEYFVDGMTDQLITNLAQSTSLRVISRTSVMQFKNVRKPLPEIARALNVDAVVEGSVMRYGGRLNIQAQLLDARRDRHLWAQTYTGSDASVLELQDEVTRDIAENVAATLRPASTRVAKTNQHVDTAAYEDYLRGRYYLAKRTPEALRKSVEYFEKAINASPNYARAYVGLADACNVISFYGGPPPSESFPKAEAAAKKALALEPGLGEAHAALGETLFSYYWDWPGAEREFREAIRLAPEDASAHHWYSQLLSMLRRHNEAISQIRKAQERDPLSLVINATAAGTLYLAHRYEDAEKQIKGTLDLDSSYGPAHGIFGWILIYTHRAKQATGEFKRAIAESGDSPSLLANLGCAYAVAGDFAQARKIAAELEIRSRDHYVSPEALARLYLFLGENALAMAKLETAYQMHVDTLNNIYAEPCYDKLRNNPQFEALLRQMHFVK